MTTFAPQIPWVVPSFDEPWPAEMQAENGMPQTQPDFVRPAPAAPTPSDFARILAKRPRRLFRVETPSGRPRCGTVTIDGVPVPPERPCSNIRCTTCYKGVATPGSCEKAGCMYCEGPRESQLERQQPSQSRSSRFPRRRSARPRPRPRQLAAA